jgi:hypothetical protein
MMKGEEKVVSLNAAKAKAAGISPDMAQVIEQLNARFGIRIELSDERLDRFKSLFPALDSAANQHHAIELERSSPEVKQAFAKGVEVGKAQMMTDVIICILEQDGVLNRDQ